MAPSRRLRFPSQTGSVRLSGTVSVPLTFPELGQIDLIRNAVSAGVFDCEGPKDLIVARQQVSPRITINRSFLADDVAAIFVPNDIHCVNLNDGTWLTGIEVATVNDIDRNAGALLMGIVYVRESAPSLLNVDAGMTAAESAEYYPPLADDRSANHYQFRKRTNGAGQIQHAHPSAHDWPPSAQSWPSVQGNVEGLCFH